MNHLWAVFYGIIQGLTEFLPVSSSGHLALLPYLGNIKDPGLSFDLAMHIGTALAVFVYFHKRVFSILRNLFNIVKPQNADQFFAQYFIIATFVSGSLALILKPLAELYGRNHLFISFNLVFFGIILYFIDKYGKVKEDPFKKENGIKAAFFVGLFQVLAIFPGVSRSGITITAARMFGASKEDSSSFSFLLSLPLIFGGALLKARELVNSDATFDYYYCLTGIFVSFVVGLVTIHYFLKLIKKIDFKYFMHYRLLLGAVVLFLYLRSLSIT